MLGGGGAPGGRGGGRPVLRLHAYAVGPATALPADLRAIAAQESLARLAAAARPRLSNASSATSTSTSSSADSCTGRAAEDAADALQRAALAPCDVLYCGDVACLRRTLQASLAERTSGDASSSTSSDNASSSSSTSAAPSSDEGKPVDAAALDPVGGVLPVPPDGWCCAPEFALRALGSLYGGADQPLLAPQLPSDPHPPAAENAGLLAAGTVLQSQLQRGGLGGGGLGGLTREEALAQRQARVRDDEAHRRVLAAALRCLLDRVLAPAAAEPAAWPGSHWRALGHPRVPLAALRGVLERTLREAGDPQTQAELLAQRLADDDDSTTASSSSTGTAAATTSRLMLQPLPETPEGDEPNWSGTPERRARAVELLLDVARACGFCTVVVPEGEAAKTTPVPDAGPAENLAEHTHLQLYHPHPGTLTYLRETLNRRWIPAIRAEIAALEDQRSPRLRTLTYASKTREGRMYIKDISSMARQDMTVPPGAFNELMRVRTRLAEAHGMEVGFAIRDFDPVKFANLGVLSVCPGAHQMTCGAAGGNALRVHEDFLEPGLNEEFSLIIGSVVSDTLVSRNMPKPALRQRGISDQGTAMTPLDLIEIELETAPITVPPEQQPAPVKLLRATRDHQEDRYRPIVDRAEVRQRETRDAQTARARRLAQEDDAEDEELRLALEESKRLAREQGIKVDDDDDDADGDKKEGAGDGGGDKTAESDNSASSQQPAPADDVPATPTPPATTKPTPPGGDEESANPSSSSSSSGKAEAEDGAADGKKEGAAAVEEAEPLDEHARKAKRAAEAVESMSGPHLVPGALGDVNRGGAAGDTPGVTGLQNMHSVCGANAMMQTLYFILPLRRAVLGYQKAAMQRAHRKAEARLAKRISAHDAQLEAARARAEAAATIADEEAGMLAMTAAIEDVAKYEARADAEAIARREMSAAGLALKFLDQMQGLFSAMMLARCEKGDLRDANASFAVMALGKWLAAKQGNAAAASELELGTQVDAHELTVSALSCLQVAFNIGLNTPLPGTDTPGDGSAPKRGPVAAAASPDDPDTDTDSDSDSDSDSDPDADSPRKAKPSIDPNATNPAVQLFAGFYKEEFMTEGAEERPQIPFEMLPLSLLDGPDSLHAAMERYARSTVPALGDAKDVEKHIWFTHCPPVLGVLTPRAQWDEAGAVKSVQRLDFPLELAMHRYHDKFRLEATEARGRADVTRAKLEALNERWARQSDAVARAALARNGGSAEDSASASGSGSGSKKKQGAGAESAAAVGDALDVAAAFAEDEAMRAAEREPDSVEAAAASATARYLRAAAQRARTAADKHAGDVRELEMEMEQQYATLEANDDRDLLRSSTGGEGAGQLQRQESAAGGGVMMRQSADALVYDLHAVLVHRGGARAGHYWAYVRDPTAPPDEDGNPHFLLCNDQSITRVTAAQMCRELDNRHYTAPGIEAVDHTAPGGDSYSTPTPYCLFYVDQMTSAASLSTDTYESLYTEIPTVLADAIDRVMAKRRATSRRNKLARERAYGGGGGWVMSNFGF